MSERYRKLGAWVWTDLRLDGLEKPPANAHYLYQYLLIGSGSMALPGVWRIGEAGLSEELGWRIEDFRRVFAELAGRRLVEADWKARIIFACDAFRDNPAISGTVVKAWRKCLNDLPACELKKKIFISVRATVEATKSDKLLKILGDGLNTEFIKSSTLENGETSTLGHAESSGLGFKGTSNLERPPISALQEEEKEAEEETLNLPSGDALPRSPAPPDSGEKKSHGEFGYARLTDVEYLKLKAKLNGHTADYIDRFDRWVAEAPEARVGRTRVKRRDRNAYPSILNWFNDDVKSGRLKSSSAGEPIFVPSD